MVRVFASERAAVYAIGKISGVVLSLLTVRYLSLFRRRIPLNNLLIFTDFLFYCDTRIAGAILRMYLDCVEYYDFFFE